MSKDIDTIEARYILEDRHVANLVGRVMTLIDSLGLPEKQEKAHKDMVKQEIRRIYNFPAYLDKETMNKVWKSRDGLNRFGDYILDTPPRN